VNCVHIRPHLDEPGMRSEFWQPADPFYVEGKGWFPQKFMPGSFDSTVGQIVPMTYEGRLLGHVKVISATVAEDGSGVMFVIEVVDRV
jgi:hypothetical protein